MTLITCEKKDSNYLVTADVTSVGGESPRSIKKNKLIEMKDGTIIAIAGISIHAVTIKDTYDGIYNRPENGTRGINRSNAHIFVSALREHFAEVFEIGGETFDITVMVVTNKEAFTINIFYQIQDIDDNNRFMAIGSGASYAYAIYHFNNFEDYPELDMAHMYYTIHNFLDSNISNEFITKQIEHD